MRDWGDWPVIDPATSWEDAQTALEAAELSDGLPMVPPTRGRLDAMLAGVNDPDRSHGEMPPLFGDLTAAAVAYQCVLAGCRPAELPLVLTAAEACLDPSFNLLGLATTTGTAWVAMIVHGPIAARLGLNAGTNCLGPGNRANACIGRALSLVLRNVAGARPEIGDMATMGQPGKYTFCFAENADAMLPPLHVRRGFSADNDVVTVLGVSGTAELLPWGNWDSPEMILGPVATAMASAVTVSGAARKPARCEQIVLLPPEIVELLKRQGMDVAGIQHYLYERRFEPPPGAAPTAGNDGPGDASGPSAEIGRIARSAADIHPVVTGGAGIKMTYVPSWGGGTYSVTRAVLRP